MKLKILNSCLILLISSQVLAEPVEFEPANRLLAAAHDAVAVAFSDQDYRADFTAPDPRLKLTACDHPLAADFTHQNQHQAGRLTVAVSCRAPKPWKIYLTGSVTFYRTVWVLTRAMRRGDRLGKSDLSAQRRKVSQADRFYLTADEQPFGQQLTRNLAKDSILTSKVLTAPTLIKRGDPVNIIARSPSFSVRMAGQALADGRAGQLIDVRNQSSGRVVSAVVDGRGVVSVYFNAN